MAESLQRVQQFAGTPRPRRHEAGWAGVLCLGLVLWLVGCDYGAAPSGAGSASPSAKTDRAPSPAPAAANAALVAKPVAAAPAVAAPAPTPGEPANAEATDKAAPSARCDQVCERTLKLKCGAREPCLEACSAANDGSICGAEMNAFMDCALAHPVEHWECSENGVAAIRQDYCDREQQGFMHCFTAASDGT